MFVLSQVFVILAGVAFALSYITKKKSILLILSIINNIFFGTHYLVLKQPTAAYTVYLTIAFLVAIYFLEKYNKEKYNILTAVITSAIAIFIAVKTWQGAISLIPLIAILFVYVGCIFKNVITVKTFNLLSTITTTNNLILIKSYLGIVQNVIILIIAIVSIILSIKKAQE